MATDDQVQRLHNIIGWVRSAKETLPTINDGRVAPDRIAHMSALLDRLHTGAVALRDKTVREVSKTRDHRAA